MNLSYFTNTYTHWQTTIKVYTYNTMLETIISIYLFLIKSSLVIAGLALMVSIPIVFVFLLSKRN